MFNDIDHVVDTPAASMMIRRRLRNDYPLFRLRRSTPNGGLPGATQPFGVKSSKEVTSVRTSTRQFGGGLVGQTALCSICEKR